MQRNNAIDAVKGFAILLVMIGHCIVLNNLHQTDPYIYDAIKSVQMPLFMLVSGVLASYGVRKNGRGTGLKKLPQRAVSYLLPFFSWFVLVHLYTHIKAGTLTPAGFAGELKELLFQTDRGLWFLVTLFVATLCTMLAQMLADKLPFKGIGKAVVFCSVSVCFYLLFFLQSRSGNTFLSPALMLQYFPFYLTGYVVNGYGESFLGKKKRDDSHSGRRKAAEAVCVAAMTVVFVWMVIAFDLTKPVDGFKTLLLQTAASFFGTVSCYAVIYRLAERYQKKTEKRGFLSFVGLYTLEIYVLHFRFARLLGLSEKGLRFYSPEGIAWIVLAFLLMSALTAVMIFIIRRIPALSLLLFGKKHLPLRRAFRRA
ncbi:MAG: acyltransferase [Lachnospiraceae bacterium]|nr:acyltransferase [Lachnospiraceae bacterium]